MMRNILFLIFILISFTLSAQNHLIGFKSGASWSNVTTSDIPNYPLPFRTDFRKGINISLTYDYFLKKQFYTGFDILYNQRGLTVDLTNHWQSQKEAILEFNYDYISLPIKFGVKYGEKKNWFTSFALTPSILLDAINISPAIIRLSGISSPREVFNVTSKENRLELGSIVELGYAYKIKRQYLIFTSIAYQQSFTSNLFPNYFPNRRTRHYSLSLNIGLKFELNN